MGLLDLTVQSFSKVLCAHCLQTNRSWMPPPLTLLSLALLLLSLLKYLSGPTGADWLEQFKWIALGSVACGAYPIVRKAWGALRNKVGVM